MKRKNRIYTGLLCLMVLIVTAAAGFAEEENQADFDLLQWSGCRFTGETEVFQPVAVRKNTLPKDKAANEYFNGEDDVYLLPEVYPYVHDCLTGGCELIEIDVNTDRILLQLKSEEGEFLRVAEWQEEEGRYLLTDTAVIFREFYTDTYHDANSVLMFLRFEDGTENFLTFEKTEAGWILVDWTDARTFYASWQDGRYIFEKADFDDGAGAESTWIAEGNIEFNQFSGEKIEKLYREYKRLFPDSEDGE